MAVKALCLNGPLRGEVVSFPGFGRGFYYAAHGDDGPGIEYAVREVSLQWHCDTGPLSRGVIAVAAMGNGAATVSDVAALLLSDAAREARQ